MEPPQIIGPAQAPAQDNVQHPDHGDIRPPKPDTFDGKGNVDLWTFTIQACLVATNITNEQQKINFIVALFRGSILHWYRSLMLRNNGQQPYATSTDLINALRANCLPIDPVRRARDRLAQPIQTGSTAAYINLFRSIMLQIPGINDDECLHGFIAGLKPHLKTQVRLTFPTNLNAAMEAATRADDAYHANNQSTNQSSYYGPQPMDIGTVRCYTCNRLGHKSVSCPSKRQFGGHFGGRGGFGGNRGRGRSNNSGGRFAGRGRGRSTN
eukprot:jgi/Chrzof1/9561/Cz04g07270.t1